MSLPDTVFIFVLALIIFGPKKLPEIGRQLGKLVGEFRRASNEFKFQIEEELRQVDIAEKRHAQPTIAQLSRETVSASNPPDSTALTTESPDPETSIPVGQYPNIATLDTSELAPKAVPPFGLDSSSLPVKNPEPASESSGSQIPPDSPVTVSSTITIAAAAGSQPRTSAPFVPSTADASLPGQMLETSQEQVVQSDRHSGQTEAEVAHG